MAEEDIKTATREQELVIGNGHLSTELIHSDLASGMIMHKKPTA